MTIDSGTAKPFRIPAGFWGIVALVLWALAVSTMIQREPYGLDEATARAILFLWSIADEVASPIVTLGIPDFRAVYLIPAGALFSGSLLAIKLCTLVVVLACGLGLYRWQKSAGDAETPLLALGLFLLAPVTLAAIDRVAIGPFLLLTLLLGAWADRVYRAARIRFSGTYFAQLLLVLAAATMHPAGLALPVVLAAAWMRNPPPEPQAAALIPGRERSHVLLGLALATLLGVLLAGGWRQQAWLGNPLAALATQMLGFEPQSSAGDALVWILGSTLAALTLVVLVRARQRLLADPLGATLALALLIAALAGDASFVMLALVVLLYWGYPLLLRLRVGGATGFAGQRGVAFVLLIVLSTTFLSADRRRFEQVRDGPALSVQDQVLRTLSASVQQEKTAAPAPPPGAAPPDKPHSGPRVASQWPGRTMLACRCSALPLPPANQDGARFLASLRGTDFVVFDPLDPANRELSRNFAVLGGAAAETVSLQAGGVVLRLHADAPVPAEPAPPLPGGPTVRG